jgi:maltose alpha-D-glucosyltransferase / alpha-amylase
MLGALEYRKGRGEPMTLAVLQGFVHNEGTGWKFALDALSSFCERALAKHGEIREVPVPAEPLLDLAGQEPPQLALEVIGSYLDSARLLGQRTAEMHQVLASAHGHASFTPEGFTTLYQRSLYQSMRSLTGKVFHVLHRQKDRLPEAARADALAIDGEYNEIIKRFQTLIHRKLHAALIRIHGDYHLGQVLYTGKDFIIIDFEGEPIHPLSERRLKRSPLRDVAGMIRSFSYAAHTALQEQAKDRDGARGMIRPEDRAALAPWLEFWYAWVSAAFLRAYLAVAQPAGLLPPTGEETGILLDAFLLQKAVYELGYELQHRPDWVRVPIQGIRQLLRAERLQEAHAPRT